MLHKQFNKSKEQGFTIIEVLIVLAIAALILLIVFLAVPALQRNARNTSRNSDAAGSLGAINEFVNNNNGTAPVTATCAAGVCTLAGAGGSGLTTSEFKTGYYNKGNGAAAGDVVTAVGVGAVTNGNTDALRLVGGAKCGTGATVGDAVVGSNREFVVLYSIENSSGGATVKKCVQS